MEKTDHPHFHETDQSTVFSHLLLRYRLAGHQGMGHRPLPPSAEKTYPSGGASPDHVTNVETIGTLAGLQTFPKRLRRRKNHRFDQGITERGKFNQIEIKHPLNI
jgi:hypothetical protein